MNLEFTLETYYEHLTAYKTEYDKIGCTVSDDGSILYKKDDQEIRISDSYFLVQNRCEIQMSENNSKWEISLSAIKNNRVIKTVTVKSEELSNPKWILNSFSGDIYINSLYPRSYKIVKEMINLQTSRLNKTIAKAYIGWTKDSDDCAHYILGSEILPNNKKTCDVPHDSIANFTMEDEPISESDAIIFVKNKVLKVTNVKLYSTTTFMFVLLSMITSLLSDQAEKPSMVLVIRGLSLSRKSAYINAMMNVLKVYQGKPLASFTATESGVLKRAASVRDLPFYVDDLFPAKNKLHNKMINLLCTLLRIYGDNGERLTAVGKQARIQNLLAITCEEVPLDLAPSDYARMLVLTFNPSTVNTEYLTILQNNKRKYNAFLKYYIEYIATDYKKYISDIYCYFKKIQVQISEKNSILPGRLQSAEAWLIAQYEVFLDYLQIRGFIQEIERQRKIQDFTIALGKEVESQNSELGTIDPCKLYCTAISEMINKRNLKILEINSMQRNYRVDETFVRGFGNNGNGTSIKYPTDFLGFKHGRYYLLINSLAYGVFKDYCLDKGMPFVFSQRRLLSILVDRGLIEPENHTSTSRIMVNGMQHRVVKIDTINFLKYAGDENNES